MKLTKWMSFALILSLSINALVLGFVGLRLYNELGISSHKLGARGDGRRARSSGGRGDFSLFQRALPRDVKKQLRASIKARHDDFEQHFETIQKSREAISVLLSEDEVNNVALNAAFSELREANVAVQTIMQEETIIALESLTKEQRSRVVEGLKKREQRRQRKLERKKEGSQ